MAVSRQNLPALLEEGLDAVYDVAYGDSMQEWRQLFQVKRSRKAEEQIQKVIYFGYAKVKREGEAIEYDRIQQGYLSRFKHVVYALGFPITKEMVRDNLYQSQTKDFARGLAKALRDTKEVIHANHFNFAYSTDAEWEIGDGGALIRNNHPTLGGDQSNVLPTAAQLSEITLENMRILCTEMKDDRGIETTIMPTKLAIAPALEYKAYRILNSNLRPGTADNDPNAMRSMHGALPVAVCRRFTNPNRFFMLTNAPYGFIHYRREGVETQMKGDFETSNMLYKAEERYSSGVAEWRAVIGNGAV